MIDEALLIDLSDSGNPEKIAKIVRQHIPRTEDVSSDLNKIAQAVGITEIKPINKNGFEGALVSTRSKNEGIILFNIKRNPHRKNFTIAHELGHFLIPSHDENAQCTKANMHEYSGANKKEIEANEFAIELLAPKKEFDSFINQKKEPDIEQIISAQEKFSISKEAVCRRYANLTDNTLAFIFTKGTTTRYFSKTKDFPFLAFKPKEEVPPHIKENIKNRTPGDITDWYCVDPHFFLDNPSDARGRELYAQTLIQSNGYSITLISLEYE